MVRIIIMFYIGFIMGLILTILLAIFKAGLVRADDLGIYKLQEVSIDYKRFKEGGRDPLFYNSHMKEQLDFNIKNDLFTIFYLDLKLHSMTDESQYHIVGLNYQTGIRLSKMIKLYYEHFSKHVLDEAYPADRFPVYDAWGIQINLFSSPSRRETLF